MIPNNTFQPASADMDTLSGAQLPDSPCKTTFPVLVDNTATKPERDFPQELFPDLILSAPQKQQPAATSGMIDAATAIAEAIGKMSVADAANALNQIRGILHEVSPFKHEPVDYVQWVPNTTVHANDYNPNSVAPPEMELLRLSIAEDGYTQPIVTFKGDDSVEVIDGFHRHRVGKECLEITARVHAYLPVVSINDERTDKGDRIASTIRHNRARGKHKVDSMSDIVVELKRRNWSDEKISTHLGMDSDEVLRLSQISGLAEMFANQDFSSSWDVDSVDESEIFTLED